MLRGDKIGKGQVGAGSAPRAVGAVPPANLRQLHSDSGGGQGAAGSARTSPGADGTQQGGGGGRRGMLVPSAALRARASQGLGTCGAPGLQAPSLGAVSFPTLFRKKEGETCVGAQGQDRAPHSGECGKMEPATWAWHSAWPMKSPVPVGHCTDSTPPVRWCPGTLGWESSRGVLPFPPLSPGSSSQPAPQWVMEGSCPVKAPGGVWAVGRGNSCGRHGGQAVLQPSHRSRPHPVRNCAWRDLSPLGPRQVHPAQKMLCRRLFARPGGWLARPR